MFLIYFENTLRKHWKTLTAYLHQKLIANDFDHITADENENENLIKFLQILIKGNITTTEHEKCDINRELPRQVKKLREPLSDKAEIERRKK